jgi:hypothetical protein
MIIPACLPKCIPTGAKLAQVDTVGGKPWTACTMHLMLPAVFRKSIDIIPCQGGASFEKSSRQPFRYQSDKDDPTDEHSYGHSDSYPNPYTKPNAK